MQKSALLTRYDAVLTAFDRVVSGVVIVCMAVLTIVLLLQVFYRYILNDSIQWGWDVPRVCFIFAVMFAIPLGIRHNAHVGIDLLIDQFGPRARRSAISFNAIFMFGLAATLSYYAFVLAGQTWDQTMPGIPLSVGVLYVALVISQVHVCLHLVRILATGELPSGQWSET